MYVERRLRLCFYIEKIANFSLFFYLLLSICFLRDNNNNNSYRNMKTRNKKGNYDAIRLTHTLLLLCCFSSSYSASVPNIPHLSPPCHRQIYVIFKFGGCFRRIMRGRTKWRRNEWMYTRSYICTSIHMLYMNIYKYICMCICTYIHTYANTLEYYMNTLILYLISLYRCVLHP